MTNPEPTEPTEPTPVEIAAPIIATSVLVESTHSVTDRLIAVHIQEYFNLTDEERVQLKPIVRDLVNTAEVQVTWPETP